MSSPPPSGSTPPNGPPNTQLDPRTAWMTVVTVIRYPVRLWGNRNNLLMLGDSHGRWLLGTRPAQPFRPLLHLFAFYPLLLLIVATVFALVHGWLLSEYDAFHVIWHEHWLIGALNGIGVGLILGGALLATYLLDQEPRPARGADSGPRLPKPISSPWSYWIAWWVLLALAALPAFASEPFRVKYPVPDGGAATSPCDPTAPTGVPPQELTALQDTCTKTWSARYWFPLGLLAIGALFTAIRRKWPNTFRGPEAEAATVEAAAQGDPAAAAVVAAATSENRPIPPRHRPFLLAWWLALVLTGGYIVLVLLHATFGDTETFSRVRFFPASLSLLLLFGFLTAVTWRLTTFAIRRAWGLYPLAIGLLVVPFLIPNVETQYRLPNVDYSNNGTTASYYDTGRRVRLADYPHLRNRDVELVNDAVARDNWHARIKKRYGGARPLAVVSVSGGASASALYTADLLFTLELESPGFSDQIRIISGASGGMLGAAYFVAHYRPHTLLAQARDKFARAWKKWYHDRSGTEAEYITIEEEYKDAVRAARAKARGELGADFLAPIVQQWVHKDIPLYFRLFWRGTTNDRGAALEAAWRRELGGALDVPLVDLRAEEARGEIPSLIFTPLMIEDGRQLIISNLDLDYMVDSTVPKPKAGAEDYALPQEEASHTGVEFYRLFPEAKNFKLSTAVRLNASFPFFSPSPALPTNPERHVVDAGYYDNYGTLTATRWITRHATWLNETWWPDTGLQSDEEVPGVFLVQARCFAYETQTRRFVTEREAHEVVRVGEGGTARTETGLHSLSAPLFGLFSSWRANMVYRGDERVDAARMIVRQSDAQGVRVDRILFECPFEPSLNWTLTGASRWRLKSGGGDMVKTEFERIRAHYDSKWVDARKVWEIAQSMPVEILPGSAAGPRSALLNVPDQRPALKPPPGPPGPRTPAAGRDEFYWRLRAQGTTPPRSPLSK